MLEWVNWFSQQSAKLLNPKGYVGSSPTSNSKYRSARSGLSQLAHIQPFY